ncbi:hypothetical protein [Janthinobacterium sp. LB3P118]|uniref:hypothetical protein n=1 Tax=Janthinobacterium sp. LB3P118 TaxID=3424195 RepID=UPI003F239937
MAKSGETSEYGAFMNGIGLNWRNSHHRGLTGEILGQIFTNIYDLYIFLPAVLVVNKASKRPSEPFFQLGRDYGAYNPKKQSDAVFFEMMKTKVFASAKRPAVWAWHDELGA